MTVTAVILAGGAGRRLGGAIKPLLVVAGERIVDRQLAILAPRVDAVVVSAQDDAPWSPVAVVRDEVAGAGPLAGIAAAFAATTTPWLLVVAGDMPWLAGGVIDAILAAAATTDAAAVVPRIGGFPEPLLAAYGRAAAPALAAALAAGERSPSRLLQRGAF